MRTESWQEKVERQTRELQALVYGKTPRMRTMAQCLYPAHPSSSDFVAREPQTAPSLASRLYPNLPREGDK
jgi:hypothetical protein